MRRPSGDQRGARSRPHFIDCNEAVIATRGNKSQLRSIWRPLRRADAAADLEQLSIFAAHRRPDPEMTVADPDHLIAGRSKDWPAALACFRGASRAHIDDPDFLSGASGIARWIGHFACLVFVAAAHVSDCVSIGREGQVRQLLPVVSVVMRQLPRRKRRRFRDPDVASAFSVEGPGDLVAAFGNSKLRRKRRTHHLFEGEALRIDTSRDDDQQRDRKWQE